MCDNANILRKCIFEGIYILAPLKLTIKLYFLNLITTKMFTVRYV